MPKKKKNSDFQKVKLKVGRKIQRATNETKAQLKVKAINVRGQFKQGQTPTTESGKRTVVKDIDIKVFDLLIAVCVNIPRSEICLLSIVKDIYYVCQCKYIAT
jgi:hypothetical protein